MPSIRNVTKVCFAGDQVASKTSKKQGNKHTPGLQADAIKRTVNYSNKKHNVKQKAWQL